MEKVRVISKPYRGHQVGDVVEMSGRDARFLTALRRVEAVGDGEAPKSAPPKSEAPKKKAKRTPRKKKAAK